MSVLPAVLRPGSAANTRRGERLIEFFLRAAAAIGVVTTLALSRFLWWRPHSFSLKFRLLISSLEHDGLHRSFPMHLVSSL